MTPEERAKAIAEMYMVDSESSYQIGGLTVGDTTIEVVIADAIRDAVAEAEAEVARLRGAGRHVLTALYGAADKGGWTRGDILALAKYLSKEYPSLDPFKGGEKGRER